MDITAKQWKQQLQYQLQGKDYEELITLAGDMPVLPFYTAENVKSPYSVTTHTEVAVTLFVSDKEQTLKRIEWWQSLSVRFFVLTLHPTLTKEAVQQWLPPTLPYLFADTLTADITAYQNAGASIVQQLAFGIAQLQENTHTATPITIKTAVGSTFLLEIAKLRALRRLLAEQFGSFCLIAEVSNRGLSLLKSTYNEHYVQLAYEAAILGGADYLLPKQPLFFKKNNHSAEREQVAAIQQLTASRKAAVLNGVYGVETLSYELYKKTLVLLEQVQKQGGLQAMLKNHSLQKQIAQKARQEQEYFNEQCNKYLPPETLLNVYTRKEWDFFPFGNPKNQLPPRNLWQPEK